MKNDAKAESGKTIAQFHVFDDAAKLLVENAVSGKKGTLTRRAATPKVSKIEQLAVLQVTVGKEKPPDIGEIPHQRSHSQRWRPGGIAEHSHIFLGMLGVRLQMFFEQARIGQIVVVEEE